MTDQYKLKLKAEKALAIAKAIPRKPIFLQKAVTGEMLSGKTPYAKRKGKNIDHADVIEMLKYKTQTETAQYFKVSNQAISYIKNKYKYNGHS